MFFSLLTGWRGLQSSARLVAIVSRLHLPMVGRAVRSRFRPSETTVRDGLLAADSKSIQNTHIAFMIGTYYLGACVGVSVCVWLMSK